MATSRAPLVGTKRRAVLEEEDLLETARLCAQGAAGTPPSDGEMDLRRLAGAIGRALPDITWTARDQCDTLARAIGPQWLDAYGVALYDEQEAIAGRRARQEAATMPPSFLPRRFVRRRLEPAPARY
jgi:hypothetical protein